MADKIKSINEKEAREAVHAALVSKGVKVTKTVVDQVMDAVTDLSIKALVAGSAIKVQGLGTLEIRTHKGGNYKVPDPLNAGQFLTGTAPAGKHVLFVESDSLLEAMNAPISAD